LFVRRGDEGFWVTGSIAGQKSNGKTSPDYKIQILEKTLERAPAVRIRRYFAPGDAVEVYRGSSRGWVPATVQERLDKAGKAEYPASMSNSSPQPGTSVNPPHVQKRPAANVAAGAGSGAGHRAKAGARIIIDVDAVATIPPPTPQLPTSAPTPALEKYHPWVNVLIAEELESGSPAKEKVPLWLLRQPVAANSHLEHDIGDVSLLFAKNIETNHSGV